MAFGITDEEFLRVAAMAEEAGIRLEIIQDIPVWELMPSVMHNADLQAILATIRAKAVENGCPCFPLADVTVRFRDGSLRRPDISIFCSRPPRTREATSLIPAAVVEVVSPSSVIKDTQISPPFYLAQGVKDVFVYDPEALTVQHIRVDGRRHYQVPIDLETEAGCVVGFPKPPDDDPMPSVA